MKAALLVLLFAGVPVLSQQKQLTPEQQASFLAARTDSPIAGTFDSVCSNLYATESVAIHTNSDRINAARITPTFPEFYQPTWKEVFALIAMQTRSEWNYDPEQGYWVFRESNAGLPYRLKTAPGWRADIGAFEVNYRPPKLAPVGMDVYWLGSYSTDPERVREELAMHFVRGYVKDVSPQQMKKVRVGKAEALYFEATGDSGDIWRQWVMVDKGQGLAIVSAIRPEHEKDLLPDVLAMVESFEAVKPGPVPPGRTATPEERASALLPVALGLAMGRSQQDFVGYMAVAIDAGNWESLKSDEDLGAFLKLRERAAERRAIVLMKGRQATFCVYFDGESPVGAVAGSGGKLDAAKLRTGYEGVAPQTPRRMPKELRYDSGTITADDGTPVVAFRITAIK